MFADAKEKHGMRYTQYRGLAQVTNWLMLKFAAMNLKKLATWKWKRKNPSLGKKADILFFYPTKECLQFLYVTVIEVLQSVKDIDTVGFITGTGKEFLRGYAKVFTDAQKFVHRGHCLAD